MIWDDLCVRCMAFETGLDTCNTRQLSWWLWNPLFWRLVILLPGYADGIKSNLGMASQLLLRLVAQQGVLLKQMMQPLWIIFKMQRLSVEYWVQLAVIQADACVVEEG